MFLHNNKYESFYKILWVAVYKISFINYISQNELTMNNTAKAYTVLFLIKGAVYPKFTNC